ncbi:MAG: hypothetical protein M1830_001108 [Pleopsidium flavum]|nr:MAG: hypothetical protein M1830_001108 [Pleopsidium flavum]
MAAKESNTPDRHANDRLLFLLANFTGLTATITTKTGDRFTGIFAGASLENNESAYLLKMVQQVRSTADDQSNGVGETSSNYLGSGADHAMSFEIKDVMDLAAENVSFNDITAKSQNGTSSGFRTDADISGNLALRERNLQRWEPSTETDVDLSLESAGGASWDQFEANERLYGVRSNYDEEIYTTSIDRSNPLYKQRAARAEKIAREIEGDSTTNVHMKEERGLTLGDDSGMDEEERYSGVRRDGADFPALQSSHPNKYTPPARRPPTSQATVPGAPVDPAIISSQISRPEPKPSQERKSNSYAQTEKSAQSNAGEQAKYLPIAPIPPSKPTSSAKSVADLEQTKPNPGRNLAPSVSASPNRKPGPPENATSNVETEVLDSFRQFANTEKMRVLARRRNQASQDKAIKLNDLMKFSKNFKLLTPVPKDLVPILAKDKTKQEEIMEKAQRLAEEASNSTNSTPKSLATNSDQKAQRPLATARYDVGTTSPVAPADRQNFPRGRQGHAQQGQYNNHPARMERSFQAQNVPAVPPRAGTGLLGHRLADIQRQKHAGAPVPVPSPLPIHEKRAPPTGPAVNTSGLSSPQKRSNNQTPTSAVSSKFNVKAVEFKPNPTASSFTPVGNVSGASSPRSTANAHTSSRAPTPSAFFGSKKPLPSSERPSIKDHFNPIKRLTKESEEQETTKTYASNGGIKPAYKTPPTWDVTKENEEKTYQDMFDDVPFAPPSASPQHVSPANPQLPHQHQLPFHLQHGAQGVPQVHVPHQAPHQLHPQQHLHPAGPHHYDDHRMHVSSSSSSVFPSPRPQYSNMAYPSPMAQHAQLAYGQPMPPYFMGPNGPQPTPLRQFPGGPQYVTPPGAHLGAPMMVQQHSNGSFMSMPQAMAVPFNPQMQMYSPGQGHAIPHYGGPPQPPSNYPSPGRGAPLMIHQGSQQGQHPQQVMFMTPGHPGQPMYAQQQPAHMAPMRGAYPPPQQPYYASSPHQPHHFPHQPHRAPSSNYGQSLGQHSQNAAPPPPPPTAPAAHAVAGGEEVK